MQWLQHQGRQFGSAPKSMSKTICRMQAVRNAAATTANGTQKLIRIILLLFEQAS